MPPQPVLAIPWQQVLWIMGGATTLTTAIFWGAYFAGKLMQRIEALEGDVLALKSRKRAADMKESS